MAAYFKYKPPQDRERETSDAIQAMAASMPVIHGVAKLDTSAWDAIYSKESANDG